MDWDDLAKLAADPLVTIGSATVNYPALSNLKEADAQREMTMGKAVAETALRRAVRHFAYPFGDRQSWRREHVVMGQEAGFASAVSTIPGVVEAKGFTNLHALPRIAWDGRQRLAAHDARDAVGDDVSRGQADPGQLGLGREFINPECLWAWRCPNYPRKRPSRTAFSTSLLCPEADFTRP